MDERSQWIWPVAEAAADSYGEFTDTFCYEGGPVELRLSADSNYAVYLNGKWVDSGQYPDFPHYKVYDRLDVTPYCREGENRLAIIVWYYGVANMSYFPGRAALRYEVWQGERLTAYSAAATRSRMSRAYENGRKKDITFQLGFSFHYDLTKEDTWLTGGGDGFGDSVVVEQDLPMYERPIPKCVIGEPIPTTCVKRDEEGRHYLLDLGAESVGFLTLRLTSSCVQTLTICYGEHIVDGGVRRFIDARDFSVLCTVAAGENTYTNPFRRFGLRYLEIFSEEPINLDVATVLSVEYPIDHRVKRRFDDPLRQRIYDVSVRTLELCMHDHYEDTPWREQGLYAMDSRNQMLCGYYAFEEYTFPRASLLLMSKDERPDGLLCTCAPCGIDLALPSFALYYITEVYEYACYAGDTTLVKEVYPKLYSIINTFLAHMKDGLVPTWPGEEHFNFYEWSDGLDGLGHDADYVTVDTCLNCLFVMALERMHALAKVVFGYEESTYLALADKVRQKVREQLFCAADGAYRNSVDDPRYSELANALAILSGVAEGDSARVIAARLADPDSGWTPTTLSMVCFKYDAMLQVDKETYAPYVLADIDRKYKRMLDAGASSFWETEEGESAFDNAGSLCHAWSAMPVYYYSTLLNSK